MMKRARKVSNFHGEVHFKENQSLTIVFTENTRPNRKQTRNDVEDLIVNKIACH